jgi:hypothetical protein
MDSIDQDLSALAHQQELEYQQWYQQWVDSEDFINHVNGLVYDALANQSNVNQEYTL